MKPSHLEIRIVSPSNLPELSYTQVILLLSVRKRRWRVHRLVLEGWVSWDLALLWHCSELLVDNRHKYNKHRANVLNQGKLSIWFRVRSWVNESTLSSSVSLKNKGFYSVLIWEEIVVLSLKKQWLGKYASQKLWPQVVQSNIQRWMHCPAFRKTNCVTAAPLEFFTKWRKANNPFNIVFSSWSKLTTVRPYSQHDLWMTFRKLGLTYITMKQCWWYLYILLGKLTFPE